MEIFFENFKYIAFILLAIACLMRKDTLLRMFLSLTCLAGIAYSLIGKFPSMSEDIFGLSLLLVINLLMFGISWSKKRPVKFLDKNEELLYQCGFTHFNRDQFRKIVKVGTFIKADAGDVVTELGKPVSYLIMIIKGKCRVLVGGQTIAFSNPGDLVGEMSFVTHAPASATVYIIEPTVYIKWPQGTLRKLLDSDPNLKQAMQTVFNADFFRKHKTGKAVDTSSPGKDLNQDVPPNSST